MERNELISILLTVVLSSITGFFGWLFGRRKSKADAQSVELENVAKAVEIWREAAENLNEQLRIYNDQYLAIRDENIKLRSNIAELTAKVDSLTYENASLRKEIEKLKSNGGRNGYD
jgi:cell division protein FtsB